MRIYIGEKMKITRCKYGHYYDKAYFRECPHCCRARGGRDEDIIIGKNELSTDLSGKNSLPDRNRRIEQLQDDGSYGQSRSISQKEQDRKKVERWIGEAWDELEEILNENDNSSSERLYEDEKKDIKDSFSDSISGEKKQNIEEKRVQRETINTEKRVRERENSSKISSKGVGRKELEKVAKVSPKTKVTEKTVQIEKQEEDRRERIIEEKDTVSVKKQHRNFEQNLDNYMLFAAMPLKVIKNQEFCMDFCIFPEEEWETGAKMLSFKSQESIRDLKPVQMELPERAVLHILYKEEEIFQKEIELEPEKRNVFCTFPVTVTDTRDRRFHMIKAVFEVEEQNIEIPLYLMPNP